MFIVEEMRQIQAKKVKYSLIIKLKYSEILIKINNNFSNELSFISITSII
jgi:hypothetical protein